MKRFILTQILILINLSAMYAQHVKDINATANNDTIVVSCILETSVFCSLQLQYSDNNGLTWNDCQSVRGDITKQAGGKKLIYWNCLKDNVIMGNFIFKVIVYPSSMAIIKNNDETQTDIPGKVVAEKKFEKKDMKKEKSTKGNFAILPGCSFGNTTSYSIMLGYINKWGGYIKVKSSFGSRDSHAEKGDVDDAFFNGNSNKGRFSAYAGVMGQLHPNIILYAGAGYGNKWLQWETVSNTNIEIQSATYSAIDPEIGILFKIKMFTIGGGFNCLIGKGHKNGEGNISAGVMF